MHSIRRLRLLAVTAALIAAALPGTAAASCVVPQPLAESVRAADVVIVGTVGATENQGRWATINVEEIWKGPDLPPTAVVRAGPAGDTFSSVDRTFDAGVRYLFLLGRDAQGGLTDNACSLTTPWEVGLAALRPADFRAPTAIDDPDDAADAGDAAALVVPAIVALLVAAALLGIGLLARGRQSA
jgi:hypothetical protein